MCAQACHTFSCVLLNHSPVSLCIVLFDSVRHTFPDQLEMLLYRVDVLCIGDMGETGDIEQKGYYRFILLPCTFLLSKAVETVLDR